MTEFDEIFDEQETEETPESKEEQSYSREDWLKRKDENRSQAFEMLEQATAALGTAGMLQQYLDVQSRFDRYSVSNALLIAHQKPDATRIADAKTWQKSGAYIKKGEKALSILEPGREYTRQDGTKGVNYDAKKVFDIAQTTAEPPERRERQQDDRKLVRALMKTSPVQVEISNDLPQNENAVYSSQQKTIFVRQGLPGPDIFRALSREIAHARLDKGGTTRDGNAFAADCISYLLCKRNGVEPAQVPDTKPLEGKEAKETRGILKGVRDEANGMSAVMEKALINRDRDAR